MNRYALINPAGDVVKRGTKKACESLKRYYHALYPKIKFTVVRKEEK